MPNDTRRMITTNSSSELGSPFRMSSSPRDFEPPTQKRQKTETVGNQDNLSLLVASLLTTVTQQVIKQNAQALEAPGSDGASYILPSFGGANLQLTSTAAQALVSAIKEKQSEQKPDQEVQVSVAKKQQTEQKQVLKASADKEKQAEQEKTVKLQQKTKASGEKDTTASQTSLKN